MRTTITTVSAKGSSLDVEWSDGEKSSFNFLWQQLFQKFQQMVLH